MFASPDAKAQILDQRKGEKLKHLVLELVLEAGRLGIAEAELTEMMRQANEELKGEVQS